MENETKLEESTNQLVSAELKPSKLSEFRALIGRMLALSWRAQFYITFTKSITFIYMHDDTTLQTRIIGELVNASFFEAFDVKQSIVTFTTGSLKEVYWFLGLNAPVVVFGLKPGQSILVYSGDHSIAKCCPNSSRKRV